MSCRRQRGFQHHREVGLPDLLVSSGLSVAKPMFLSLFISLKTDAPLHKTKNNSLS